MIDLNQYLDDREKNCRNSLSVRRLKLSGSSNMVSSPSMISAAFKMYLIGIETSLICFSDFESSPMTCLLGTFLSVWYHYATWGISSFSSNTRHILSFISAFPCKKFSIFFPGRSICSFSSIRLLPSGLLIPSWKRYGVLYARTVWGIWEIKLRTIEWKERGIFPAGWFFFVRLLHSNTDRIGKSPSSSFGWWINGSDCAVTKVKAGFSAGESVRVSRFFRTACALKRPFRNGRKRGPSLQASSTIFSLKFTISHARKMGSEFFFRPWFES